MTLRNIVEHVGTRTNRAHLHSATFGVDVGIGPWAITEIQADDRWAIVVIKGATHTTLVLCDDATNNAKVKHSVSSIFSDPTYAESRYWREREETKKIVTEYVSGAV